jgi:membrane protein implicated in regulation of membrane protease activity
MNLRRRQRSGSSRRTKRSALTYTILLGALSAAFIIFGGMLTSGHLTTQTIAFAILGAVLQTAVLGLLYEVLLRDEVEDNTLEKLNLSADVKRHGLVRMDDDAAIDWQALLDERGDIFIVTSDPGRLFGSADNRLFLTWVTFRC